MKEIDSKNEKVDILINNAGVSMRVHFIDYPYKNNEYMTNLNYNSPIALTKAVLPHMIKNK